jgi:type IV pilus assembly protein PilN
VQLVRNLERSQRFLAPRLAGESSLTAEKAKALGQSGAARPGLLNVSDNGVEFEIFSGYNPLPEEQGTAKRDQGTGKKPSQTQPVVKHDRHAKAGGAR